MAQSTDSAPSRNRAQPDSGVTTGSSTRRAQRSESIETQARILDAAEALFVDMGFAATSVRAIAKRADVNLAAAHYHFGSKEGLLEAAFHRAIAPINALRLELLDALERDGGSPNVRQIVEAFIRPLSDVPSESVVPRIIGRLYGEPNSVSRPLIKREFNEVALRYSSALQLALPHLPEETLRWRFHFVIGSMIHLLAFDSPPVPLGVDLDTEHSYERLIDFCVNGLDPDGACKSTPEIAQ